MLVLCIFFYPFSQRDAQVDNTKQNNDINNSGPAGAMYCYSSLIRDTCFGGLAGLNEGK